MTLRPFPVEALEWDDYTLGGFLLAYFTAAQADDLGIPTNQIPEEFAELVRQHVLTLETQSAKNAALEKALHKAASGDFAKAGKLLREHMINGAVGMKFVPIGIARVRQQSAFGKKGATSARATGDDNRSAILVARDSILKNRKRQPSQNELAQLIADKTGIPYNTVRGQLTRLKKQKAD